MKVTPNPVGRNPSIGKSLAVSKSDASSNACVQQAVGLNF